MEIAIPWNDNPDIISSDESSSDDDMSSVDDEVATRPLIDIKQPPKEITSESATVRKAEMYQDYMRKLPIPRHRGTVIPFSSWVGLGNSLKQLYGQPLHYLTNRLLQQWDQLRFDNGDDQDLDIVIHPCKAEASVWLVEEMHRLTASHHYIAKLWLSDLKHRVFVDSIFPELCSNRPESAAGDASV